MAFREMMNLFKVALLVSLSFGGSIASSTSSSSSLMINENRQWNLPSSTHLSLASSSRQPIEDRLSSKKNIAFLANFPRGGDVTAVVDSKATVIEQLYVWVTATPTRCWVVLMIAITMEIVATAFMKTATDNDDKMALTAAMTLYMTCLSLFGLTLKQIEMSVAYAVWSGLGTGMATAVGMFFFNEKRDVAKILCVVMILLGCVGLNLVASDH
uniref:EamA domain-containing protein n=1 Tax=Eucampia antarctica TaxID=49252 RepID=A0A7S2R7H4_9STRA|mmetsp:Transcript_18147/g.17526  ORF Transcript_18147/g.17526 Transcript_18147/m.17526 type:complete len:213 (+) Transcript_18147:60-698(+)|eukprot:CAMPEP_0197832406 /NCGR_PEP_ID=MMETSP1437-20131217/14617_1 /TAXON_ID=49252 ORGANISM="Eucampia antarctica, Strain CCMP1452" /NCGR_SAMPLE_ID=MMETSP1437 /ASSEMBLY_ACC=CAM_ASM_001096 /LENGTH=212 /DNA_ID=CAMNT_0043435775 /DNA_START=58 /DNA_END=696 /DNA_ORIENTATION=+